MHNFELVIGIEIHVVINSNSKMFSPAKSAHSQLANTCINEIDLGLPGVMPQPNIVVVEKAIALAKALNMTIDQNLRFDRKNYFYQDLPKGFQITQQFFPIGKNGYIDIDVEGKQKRIKIERIHLEEDTAKQIKANGEIQLDYNRAGMPLIEIVSQPEINSAIEASTYLKKIKSILEYCNLSDAKLEKGSMRADVNISIKPIGSHQFGQRVEIKNINSISNVEKAIEFESRRQWKLVVAGKKFNIETRRFDDNSNQTIYMREKTTDIDYRYMVEPNIAPIYLDNDFIQNSIAKYYVDIETIKQKIQSDLEDEKMANHLFENQAIYKIYETINKQVNHPKEVYKWLVIELMSLTNKDKIEPENIDQFLIDEITILIQNLLSETINQKQAKELVKLLYENKTNSINELIEANNFKQISDPKIITNIFKNLIANNPKMLQGYQERPERVEKFFLGMLMKETKGQANPNISTQIFKEIMEKQK